MSEDSSAAEKTTPKRGFPVKKLLALLVVVGGTVTLALAFKDQLSIDSLAAHETELRQWIEANFIKAIIIGFLVYAIATGLSVPGAAFLTLAYGNLFGFLSGSILVSFASTTGATLAFLISRYFLGNTIQERFGTQLTKFNSALEKEGAFYLFSLRLIPAVPFFVINLVMGLTPLKTRTYWWVSQVGMLPATMAYVYAGSTFPGLKELKESGFKGLVSIKLVAAFIILGILPLILKKIVNRLRPPSEGDAASTG